MRPSQYHFFERKSILPKGFSALAGGWDGWGKQQGLYYFDGIENVIIFFKVTSGILSADLI
jgi:hypothetical protein